MKSKIIVQRTVSLTDFYYQFWFLIGQYPVSETLYFEYAPTNP